MSSIEGADSSGGWSESSYSKDKKLTAMSSVKGGGEKTNNNILDLTTVSVNSEATPLLPSLSTDHRRRSSVPLWKRFCRRGFSGVGCFPEEPSYELIENFPCVFRPLDYLLLDRLPIIKWLRRYSLQYLISDIIAGISVGLMVVPQALAYASIAGLPLQVHVHIDMCQFIILVYMCVCFNMYVHIH